MIASGTLCLICYLAAALAPYPLLNLIGCVVCGFSVGIMWPGSFSKASAVMRNGGTAMFALLALGGDLGCSGGPTLVGYVSSMFSEDLKKGILAAIVFPVLLIAGTVLSGKKRAVK